MAEGSQFDLTYVSERIIAVSFPQTCSEHNYVNSLHDIAHMLKSKHANNYLVINLSEPRRELKETNPRVLDAGWPELHAPGLSVLYTVCTSMRSWLHTHPQHVLLIHCRGDKGRVGVIISAYIYLSSLSASENQALDCFAMKRFYQDGMVCLMTPSQKRYVQLFAGLLNGRMRLEQSLLLLCVSLHHIPRYHPTVCQLFVTVYQGVQAVCTSGVHQVAVCQTDIVRFALEPPLHLKGDITIVCYHRNTAGGQDLVFRVQFHTGAVCTHPLSFHKEDLDHANTDARFAKDGRVDVELAECEERNGSTGNGHCGNSHAVADDSHAQDPSAHRDMCRAMKTAAELIESHPRVPRSAEQPAAVELLVNTNPTLDFCSPVPSDPWPRLRAPSISSDSGLSSTSQRTGGQGPALKAGQGPEKHTQPQRPAAQFGLERDQRPMEEVIMTDSLASSQSVEQETGEESMYSAADFYQVNHVEHDHCEAAFAEQEKDIQEDSACHSPGNSVSITSASREAVHHLPERHEDLPVLLPVESCEGHSEDSSTHSRPSSDEVLGHEVAFTDSLSHTSMPTKSQTHMWVKEQQLVSSQSYVPTQSDASSHRNGMEVDRSSSSKPANHTEEVESEELASLALDIDESIEQLNQLILDLDPEFEPVPTRLRGPMTRAASLHANGAAHTKALPSGWKTRQASDVTAYSGDGLLQTFSSSPYSAYQPHVPYNNDSELNHETDTPLWVGSSQPPPTPAFPVSPPTPYVKSVSELSHLQTQRSDQYLDFRTQSVFSEGFASMTASLGSRGYVDRLRHTPMASDAELFRPDASASPSPPQRRSGSVHSFSTPSPLLSADSPVPVHSWLEEGASTPLSHYTPQPSPPLTLAAPNAHSSPRGAPRRLSNPLATQGLELSLLQAVEGLEALGLEGLEGLEGLDPPLLPQKRRGFEGGEIALAFPLSRASPTGATSSPDSASNKPDTVKFVQDTSKFWYKPDISREQAISVLRDKEPGSFIVRDSHSFRGAYGLAMKVATPPPSVLQQSKKGGDLSSELVRHFLIECTQKGVRLKGCPNEPYFGSLTALVCQHSITPLALPCKLIIPDRDPLEELNDSQSQSTSNSAAELLKQGAACNVWYLGSVELESLTGVQAVQKATSTTLGLQPPPVSTIVHFKVSAQGITLTDNQRKLFFRRHYAVNTVIFCALDPQDRRWMRDGCSSARIFGFVARKSGSSTENVCHLFAEHDPEQPASAIVSFVSRVMIGFQKTK